MTFKTANKLDFVILKKENDFKVIQLLPDRIIALFKAKFFLDGLIGAKYGSYFKIIENQLVKVPYNELPNLDYVNDQDGKDNRELLDSNSNQKLSKENIQSLRKQGTSGEEIVDQLVENSATFQAKTEFSQQKYIKRKQKRHVFLVCLLPLITRHIHQMYFNRGPSKLSYLREDSLAQVLTYANIHAGTNVMVYETCSGILVRAILERMGGAGKVVHIFSGTAPSRPAMSGNLALSDSQTDILYDFPVNRIADLSSDKEIAMDETQLTEDISDKALTGGVVEEFNPTNNHQNIRENNALTKRQSKNVKQDTEIEIEIRNQRRKDRLSRISDAKSLIKQKNTNVLIIAGKVHPVAIVNSLMDFLAPSSMIVVFCPYENPLIECYQALKSRGVLALKISETFFREYQFLKNRTHPHVLMSGSGGFVLTGIKINH